MSRKLDDLDARFRPKAVDFLARLVEARIPVLIACTRRSEEEQQAALAAGTSKVAHSKHQDGLAIDVVPFAMLVLHGEQKLQYDSRDPVWKTIGAIAESLGLRWGGRFGESGLGTGDGWDPGHAELVLPKV